MRIPSNRDTKNVCAQIESANDRDHGQKRERNALRIHAHADRGDDGPVAGVTSVRSVGHRHELRLRGHGRVGWCHVRPCTRQQRRSPVRSRAHESARLKVASERLDVDLRRLQRWLPACRFRAGLQRSFWTVSLLLTDLDALGGARDGHCLVHFALGVGRAGHPDDAIHVGVDTDVLQAAGVLGRELRLDLGRDDRVLDEDSPGLERSVSESAAKAATGARTEPITKQVVASLNFILIPQLVSAIAARDCRRPVRNGTIIGIPTTLTNSP